MTKQETAQQIVRQVLEFMVDNDYIDFTHYPTSSATAARGSNGLYSHSSATAARKKQADIAADDIEQLQDIAQASIEELYRYHSKAWWTLVKAPS